MEDSIKELQKAEYDILCVFADFCEKHSINYILDSGTLLGAVRHGGFIPWDDDTDIMMDYKSFKKFVKLFKKNPVPGLFLTWIDTEWGAPFPYAKLRKEGTKMSETETADTGLHEGVWLDIFIYFGRSKYPHIKMIQTQLLLNFILMGKKYFDVLKEEAGDKNITHDKKYRLVSRMPKKLLIILRKFAFTLINVFSRKNSENVLITWAINDKTEHYKRIFFEPVTKHKFEGRDFNIPENYDDYLRFLYGDYMTPVKYEAHTEVNDVTL